MSFVKTILSVLVFFGLLAFYYFYEIRGAPKRAEEQEKQERIFRFDRDAIRKISIEKGGKTLRLEKKDDQWTLVEPVESESDKGVVDEILKTLNETQQGKIVSEDQKDLESFGLGKNSTVVTAEGAGTGETYALRVGDETPPGDHVFASRVSGGPVFLVPASAGSALKKDAFDVRDKTLLKGNSFDLNRVEIDRGDFHLAAEKSGDDVWMIQKPEQLRGDRKKFEGIGGEMFNARVEEFVDDNPKDLSPYGLTEPAVTVRLWMKGDDRPQTLQFGSVRDRDQRLMAKKEHLDRVMAVPATLISDLTPEVNAYRDKSLVPLKSEEIQKLDYRNRDQDILIQREGEEEWNLIRPVLLRADNTEVDSLIRDLGSVEILKFVEKNAADLTPYGLEKPVLSFRISKKGKEEPAEVWMSTGKESGLHFAKLGNSGEVFEISGETFQKLVKSVFDLRDKHLFPAKGDSLENIKIVRDGKTLEMVKRGETWTFTDPGLPKPDTGKASNLVWSLAGLQFQSVVDDHASDFSPYGFDAPTARISVGAKDRGLLDEVIVGKPVSGEDRYFVRWSNSNGVYTVEKSFVDQRLPKGVEDLK